MSRGVVTLPDARGTFMRTPYQPVLLVIVQGRRVRTLGIRHAVIADRLTPIPQHWVTMRPYGGRHGERAGFIPLDFTSETGGQ